MPVTTLSFACVVTISVFTPFGVFVIVTFTKVVFATPALDVVGVVVVVAVESSVDAEVVHTDVVERAAPTAVATLVTIVLTMVSVLMLEAMVMISDDTGTIFVLCVMLGAAQVLLNGVVVLGAIANSPPSSFVISSEIPITSETFVSKIPPESVDEEAALPE